MAILLLYGFGHSYLYCNTLANFAYKLIVRMRYVSIHKMEICGCKICQNVSMGNVGM